MKLRIIIGIIACTAVTYCASWLTYNGDPARTGWARGESELTRDNVSHLKLLWKTRLENTPRELTALTAPVVLAGQYTPQGAMDVVIVGGSSDNLFALDSDTGKVIWGRHFTTDQKPKQQPDWLCPNALNDTPVIDAATRTVYVIAADGMLHTVQAINGEELRPAQQFVPPFSKNWSLNLVNGILYTSISQGCNAAKSGIATLNVKAHEKTPHFFQAAPAGAGIWGRGGVAVDSATGVAYGATGDGAWDPAKDRYSDSVVAVDATGKVVDYFTPANYAWITRKDLDMGNISPVLFSFGGKKLLVTGGKEGLLYLLDTASLGGADHRTPLYKTPLLCNENQQFQGRGIWGALGAAADSDGTTWLYAPVWGSPAPNAPKFPVTHGDAADGSIMAFKLTNTAGTISLAPAWISRDLAVPEPPVIANGVVFALSTGENVTQVDNAGNLLSSAQRSTTNGHAVLYAFDAHTGAELFSSGDTIPGWAHFSGLAIANGHIYAVTHDSTVYAFGLGE
jgi:outer membrane protein assembly factor BamB